jgi:hypothetical protein
MSALGKKPTFAANCDVRFTAESGHSSAQSIVSFERRRAGTFDSASSERKDLGTDCHRKRSAATQ